MRHLFRLFLPAPLAGIRNHIPAAGAAVPVVAQGFQRFLGDLAADLALVLGRAVFQAGGGRLTALDLYIFMLVGVGNKVGCQHHAAGVGIAGHRKADGRAVVAAAGAGRPAIKYKTLVGHRRNSRSRRALFDKLAGRAGNFPAVGRHKLQRYFGAAYRDRVFGDQVHRRAHRGGNGPQRLRAAVVCNICVGAYIIKIFGYSRLGKMHAVRECVVRLGPAGGIIAQHFGAVQKLVAVFFAHYHQRGIVGVHLGHCQVGVLALLVQRRNRADDNITIRPGRFNCFQPLQIGRNERGRIGGRPAQVVGAIANDNALRFQHGHGIGHRVHGGRPAELLTLQARDGPRAHADDADIIGQRRKCLACFISIH